MHSQATTEELATKKAEIIMAMKTAPPLVVSGFTLFGHPLSDWVQLATLVFIFVQIAVIIHKWKNNKL